MKEMFCANTQCFESTHTDSKHQINSVNWRNINKIHLNQFTLIGYFPHMCTCTLRPELVLIESIPIGGSIWIDLGNWIKFIFWNNLSICIESHLTHTPQKHICAHWTMFYNYLNVHAGTGFPKASRLFFHILLASFHAIHLSDFKTK